MVGFDYRKKDSVADYFSCIIQALMGMDLKQKLLLDMSQADLGRKFLEYADLGYIHENGKRSVCRILQTNFNTEITRANIV